MAHQIQLEFIDACDDGNFDRARSLYNSQKINIKSQIEGFLWACYDNHLQVAKWLYNQGNIDMSYHNHCFDYFCGNGHLDLVKWLYSLPGCDMMSINHFNDAFLAACCQGHLKVAKWLYGERDITINVLKQYTNSNATNYNLEVLTWLQQLGVCSCNIKLRNCQCRNQWKNKYYCRKLIRTNSYNHKITTTQ